MPWFVYEVRNLVNGKVYVGVARSNRVGIFRYYGSGRAVKQAVRKYGRENFARKVLHEFETADEAYAVEATIVTEEWCRRKDTYNIKTGGLGGRGHKMPASARRAISRFQKGRKKSPEEIAKITEAARGRVVSDETRAKMSEAATRRNTGRRLSDTTKSILSERMKAIWRERRRMEE